MASIIEKVQRRAARVERQVYDRSPRLPHTAVDGGGQIVFRDYEGLDQIGIGEQYDGTSTVAHFTGPNPPTPTVPVLTPIYGAIIVTWDGQFVDELVAPLDFARVEVHVSTDPDADLQLGGTDSPTLRTTLNTARSTEVTIASLVPNTTTTHYVWLVTRTQSGKYSDPSGPADAEPSINLNAPELAEIPPAEGRYQLYFKPDGMPYYLNKYDIEIPFSVGDPIASIHANSDFEAVTAGLPDGWDFFWQTGTTDVEMDTNDVLSGTKSLKVSWDAASSQVIMSDTIIAVEPGDTIELGTYVRPLSGQPRLSMGILTSPSGVPNFFAPGTISQEGGDATITHPSYQRLARSLTVPGGHYQARIIYRLGGTSGGAGSALLDLTHSKNRANPASDFDTGWLPLILEAGWVNAGASWQDCEYRRRNDELHLRGRVIRSGSASGADSIVGAIPDGFRPAASIPLCQGGMLYITADGEVTTEASVPDGASVSLQAGPVFLD